MATIVPATTVWETHRRVRQFMLRVTEVEPGVYEFSASGTEDAVVIEAETGVYEVSSAPAAVKAANVMVLGTSGHIIS